MTDPRRTLALATQDGPSGAPDGEPTPGMVEAAIGWALRVHYDSPASGVRTAFEDWLAADPLHATAWRRVQGIAGELRAFPREVTLGTLQANDAARRQRRRALKYLALAGTAGMSAWLAGQHTPWQRVLADASTATGERRTLQLGDGTTVALNTDTAISSRFDPYARRLNLLRGEIFVSTRADTRSPPRPFRVHTPQGVLEALGTRFLVRLEDDAMQLAVQEGAVAMRPERGDEAIAAAGERWTMRAAGAALSPASSLEPAGWLEGVIAARSMPLKTFLAELGRYRRGLLTADARIADQAISGVYQLQDVDRTLHFLAQSRGWRLVYRSRYWITVAPAQA